MEYAEHHSRSLYLPIRVHLAPSSQHLIIHFIMRKVSKYQLFFNFNRKVVLEECPVINWWCLRSSTSNGTRNLWLNGAGAGAVLHGRWSRCTTTFEGCIPAKAAISFQASSPPRSRTPYTSRHNLELSASPLHRATGDSTLKSGPQRNNLMAIRLGSSLAHLLSP